MVDQREAGDDDSQQSKVRVRPLTGRERVLSTALGLLFGTAGAVAVFVTGNQAGSAALLLIGGVFSLLGIQGTPVKRATNSSVELEERYELVNSLARERAATEGASDALTFLEGAVSARPELDIPYIGRAIKQLYQYEVIQALQRIGTKNHFAVVEQLAGSTADCVLSAPNIRDVMVATKARRSAGRLPSFPPGPSQPFILISNMEMPVDDEDMQWVTGELRLIVKWSPNMGDEALEAQVVPFVQGLSEGEGPQA